MWAMALTSIVLSAMGWSLQDLLLNMALNRAHNLKHTQISEFAVLLRKRSNAVKHSRHLTLI